MQHIDSHISGKVVNILNNPLLGNVKYSESKSENINKEFLKYYAGVGKSQYTGDPICKLVNNVGIRIEVDSSTIDIHFPAKYQWRMSTLNQETDVKVQTGVNTTAYVRPIHEAVLGQLIDMIREADSITGSGTTITRRKWYKMSKQYYSNGRDGETLNRYNTYIGGKSNFKYT
tara:strand:+ start:264 stop:782 length:519 start_codon:yes stop_codon:yes gene_type:complete